MSAIPPGLRYSERKLYDECPEARPVLERLARMRVGRRAGRYERWAAWFVLAMFVFTLPLTILYPMEPGTLGLPHWAWSASDLWLAVYLWRSGRRA